MNKIYLNLKDSPFSVFLTLVVFIALGYLVSLHPDGFDLFFIFIMIAGFVILTVLLLQWYHPFVQMCKKIIDNNCKSASVKTYDTFHKDIEQITKRQTDKLLQSQQFKIFLQKKQQNPNVPVTLCSSTTLDQTQQIVKELQSKEQQIF